MTHSLSQQSKTSGPVQGWGVQSKRVSYGWGDEGEQ